MEKDSGISDASGAAQRLRASAVLVEGLGPCGARIVEHLCTLGVGTVLLRDGRRVGAAEIGGVYRTVHHGQDRVAAVQSAMRRGPDLPALLGCPPEARTVGVDLHVLCTGPQAWWSLQRAEQESQAVLPVELTGSGARIGPLVSAGRTVCGECLWRHTYAEQVQLAPEPAPPPSSGSQLEPTSEQAVGGAGWLILEQAAALAAQQVGLLMTVNRRAAAQSAALVLDARTGGLAQHPVRVHPECPCLTLIGQER